MLAVTIPAAQPNGAVGRLTVTPEAVVTGERVWINSRIWT
jgi:hypothetical protein